MEKKVNIFEREVSVYDGVYDTGIGVTAALSEVLKNHGFEDLVERFRKTKSKEDKLALPVFTCSGTFLTKTNDGLDEHNGVICIDIDKKDNLDVENFDEIRSLMKQIPYVAYCGHSCGGEGYFVLMPIEDPERHLQQYLSAIDDFERCGITVDKSCKNISRTRFLSYDNEAYFNHEAVEYSRVKDDVVTSKAKKTFEYEKAREVILSSRAKEAATYKKVEGFDSSRFKARILNISRIEQIEYDDTKNKVELIITLIERDGIDITADYEDWYRIGAALANQFGEDGGEYFHRVSRFHREYNKREADYKFNSCKKLKYISIGSFFYIAEKYGVYIWDHK